MNVSDFTYLLERPEKVTAQHLQELAGIVNEFPYFQPAKAIYLKALKETDSFKYNTYLKLTAAHTTERSVLFDFITSNSFLQHQVAKTITANTQKLSEIKVKAEEVSGKLLWNDAVQFEKEESEAVLDPELFQPKPEETLQLGKPLQFNPNETHSFAEWLQLSSVKPLHRDSPSEAKQRKISIEEKFRLIEKFIEEAPKIVVPGREPENTGNLAKEREVPKNELMTETLARVYLEQKKYKKAIQAYKILSLKYPEKSGFFADQINAVKKLQQNN